MKTTKRIIEMKNYNKIIKEISKQDPRRLTDTDIAEYFLKWFDNSLFYNVDSKSYHIYDGKHYKFDPEALIIKQKINDFLTDVIDYANKNDAPMNFVNKTYGFKESRKRAWIAEAIKGKRRKEDKDIDTNLYLFNCQNGILDISGNKPKLINHSEKYLITQISNVEYKPELGEVTGKTKELLLSFFIGNEEVLNFMFEFFGVALTGYSAIRKFIYAFGSGKNGKSTFFNFFLEEIFNNYSVTINYESLTKDRNHNGATSDLVRMMNKRLAITNEAKEKLKLNTNLVKTITGGDYYQARLNYQNERSFIPQCKLIIFGNNQLSIEDSSAGMQDRFMQVPFLNKFNGDMTQTDVWNILKADKSRILNSLIAGYYRFKKHNSFNIPEIVKEESLKGFAAANNFARFVIDNLTKVENSSEKVINVYKRYKQFADDEGLSSRETLNRTGLVNSLRSSGFKISYLSKGTAIVKNCRLKDEI